MWPMDMDDVPSTSMPPFRFLDLPPELRNNIYEFAFQDYHKLIPHAITHANRQLRAESYKLFYVERKSISIDIKTPKQVTAVLNWFDSFPPRAIRNIATVTLNYEHATQGARSVVLHREVITPVDAYRKVVTGMHEEGRFTDTSTTPTEATRLHEFGLATWRACNGFPFSGLPDTHPFSTRYCVTYWNHLKDPLPAFWDAVMEGSRWISYRLEVCDGKRQIGCLCNKHPRRMAEMLRRISGRDWEKNRGDLRTLVYALFQCSLKVGGQA